MHSVLQVLLLVGPVMAEWQRLSFSSTFELPRRVVSRLNQISEQLGALGRSGREARDENYELTYRDFLLQRFHRIEAGTLRMTTNLAVDLFELFVMPRVLSRRQSRDGSPTGATDATGLMDLSAARRFFAELPEPDQVAKDKSPGRSAVDQLRAYPRNILVGAPGSGKSTFVEWLQLAVASGSEEFVLAGEQAIPLLLRVRQLDLANLQRGAALIEKATASNERATLMPHGWIDRMMNAGRVLFWLDGLDETEPELRDERLIPWLLELIRDFPECRYVVSSRPAGYPPGLLRPLEFAECDLLDFDLSEMVQYTRHWCTAVLIAQNEPEQEARGEGAKDGDNIIAGFKGHPYIRDLARNPLMLSAICLVRYFEGGELPKDRAVLYRLCVEGLLHHWDQRRGIHSEFPMEEKVRACREVALAMQLDDRAEYELDKVRATFGAILGDEGRGTVLFEHVRYRAGLLLERRAGVFAFAHLTFQEYLAARAIHEGNRRGIDPETLAREHHDGRWKEVIALYCGLAPAPSARSMLERLVAQDDSREIADVLAEAYFISGPEIQEDRDLRTRIVERLARAPGWQRVLSRFAAQDVAPLANSAIGTIRTNHTTSEAFVWLGENRKHLDRARLRKRILDRTTENSLQLCELIYTAFSRLDCEDLARLADDAALLSSRGPEFEGDESYSSQASVAQFGLFARDGVPEAEGFGRILARLLDLFLSGRPTTWETFNVGRNLLTTVTRLDFRAVAGIPRKLAASVARLIDKSEEHRKMDRYNTSIMDADDWNLLKVWAKELDPHGQRA
jgi:NACHT domain